MNPYTFLVDTYATERLKTLSVWAHFTHADPGFRPEPRARTPLEQMVHQCVSEDIWMQRMLGIDAGLPPLPEREDHLGFLECYAAASERCLERLLGRDLHSTYGPTADTGGLFQQGAPVIYRHRTVEELLLAAGGGAVESPRLPGPGSAPPAERGHRY